MAKMQQNKGIKNIEETTKYSSDSTILLKTFENVISQFRLTSVNKWLNSAKTKGVFGNDIFKVLFVLVFIDMKNINQLMLSGYRTELTCGKDVFYEYLKNEFIDWRKILLNFASQFGQISIKKGDTTDISSPKCLVIDDTLIPKTGKTIEKIGKIFDHCTHSFQLGIKALVCGYWDGKSLIPLMFSVHNELGKKGNRGLSAKELKSQYCKERTDGSSGSKRLKELNIDKITMSISFIKAAIKASFKPVYILADSWFICDTFIEQIQNIKVKHVKKLHVIGLMKTNRVVSIAGKKVKISQVPELRQKQSKIKYCKKLKCHYLSAVVEYKGHSIKAYWIKMKGNENWKTLISTDKDLGFTVAMQYYQIRWSIEVFFKECKQNLNLNNCQSTDFDSQIAWITMSFISYMMLSLRKRFDDYETMGEVFRDLKSELLEATLVEKLWLIIEELFTEIFVKLGADWEVFTQELITNQDTFEKIIQMNLIFLKTDLKKAA